MNRLLQKNNRRQRRANSVRQRIRTTSTRPRLSVTRSCKHISAQVIDDRSGRTVAAVSTTAKRFVTELAGKTKTERAVFVGREIARLAQEAGIKEVVFDRGHRRFHGRLKALAEAARKSGLSF